MPGSLLNSRWHFSLELLLPSSHSKVPSLVWTVYHTRWSRLPPPTLSSELFNDMPNFHIYQAHKVNLGIPILNPSEPLLEATSCRPISLNQCLAKVLDKDIKVYPISVILFLNAYNSFFNIFSPPKQIKIDDFHLIIGHKIQKTPQLDFHLSLTIKINGALTQGPSFE